MQICVRAVGLNFADVFAVLGLYSPAGSPPFTPGFEVSGIIQAVGDDVRQFQVGERVFAVTRFGAYTTVLNVHEDYVYHMKPNWTFAEAAAWPCQALTAWYALCILGGLNKGACGLLSSPEKRVVVHSAASGIGLMLVELIRYIGGEIIATVGNKDKIPILLQRGIPANRIIVRGTDDIDGFEKTVRARLRGQGVDVIIDPVMGSYFHQGWKLLNRGGRYIVMGSSSLMPPTSLSFRNLWSVMALGWHYWRRPKLDLIAAMNHNKTASAFNLGLLFDCSQLIKSGFNELNDADIRRPFVAHMFSFDQVHNALHEFQAGRTIGKLVLLVN